MLGIYNPNHLWELLKKKKRKLTLLFWFENNPRCQNLPKTHSRRALHRARFHKCRRLPIILWNQYSVNSFSLFILLLPMDPWEALDLDDSDLASLLRPCKRQSQSLIQSQPSIKSHISNSSPISPSQPPSFTDLLSKTQHGIFSHADSLPNNPSPSPSPSPSPLPPLSPPLPPPLSPPHPLPMEAVISRRLIPGSAGAIQAALHRRNQVHNDFAGDKDVEVSTQEYIRRLEDDHAEEFMHNPWLSALDFLGEEGMVYRTPLISVKKCVNAGTIDKVVAIIKSCASNGLGDMMAVLKDPTDTIGASIHRKVLTEGEFGSDIAVGSVLILQKVAVFPSLRKLCFLNITLNNVVKVFTPERGC